MVPIIKKLMKNRFREKSHRFVSVKCRIAKERHEYGAVKTMIRSPGGYRPSAHSQTFNALNPSIVLKAVDGKCQVSSVGHVGKQGWQKGFKLMLG